MRSKGTQTPFNVFGIYSAFYRRRIQINKLTTSIKRVLLSIKIQQCLYDPQIPKRSVKESQPFSFLVSFRILCSKKVITDCSFFGLSYTYENVLKLPKTVDTKKKLSTKKQKNRELCSFSEQLFVHRFNPLDVFCSFPLIFQHLLNATQFRVYRDKITQVKFCLLTVSNLVFCLKCNALLQLDFVASK